MNANQPTMNSAVADTLNGQRAIRRVTIRKLQERTGYSDSALRNYLRGNRDIPITAVAAIAEELGMTYAEVAIEAQRIYDLRLKEWHAANSPGAGSAHTA